MTLPGFSLNVSCPYACSGHGSCMVGGVCACDAGYMGLACEAEGGDAFCARNCSSGAGVYTNGTCACLEGSVGAGCLFNCSGHGVCTGPAVNDSCVCDFGYGGIGCTDVRMREYVDTRFLLTGGCPGNCSGHGSCANSSCVCDTNWLGADCALVSAAITGDSCPGNCSSHGACTGNQSCLCDPGYVGMTCEIETWAAGCLSNCSNRGSCTVNETCSCGMGFTGVYCEMLDISFLGATPMPMEWRIGDGENFTSLCARGCSGHGACMQGKCMCDPLFVGVDCELQMVMPVKLGALPTVACLNNCSELGACINGTCVCDAGRAGDDCSALASVQTLLEMPCPWGGGGGASLHSPCSGNGVCANGTCACLLGWQGDDCSKLACPSDCSGHGICQEDATCLCDQGWDGAGCATPICPNGCSGQGACTHNGTCICYIGFEGEDCSILADCSKRGTRECGFCKCDPGYYGDLCEQDRCEDSRIYANMDKFQPISVCSGHGKCSDYGCLCDAGFSGHNCSAIADCSGGSGAVECNGHGTCSGGPGLCQGHHDCPDQCTCDQSHDVVYSGAYCASAICPGPVLTLADGSESINQCAGKGSCGGDSSSSLPRCTCVMQVSYQVSPLCMCVGPICICLCLHVAS